MVQVCLVLFLLLIGSVGLKFFKIYCFQNSVQISKLTTTEEEINANNLVEDGDILVTLDFSALYTNIPQEDGIEACRELLEKHSSYKDKNCFQYLV